MRLSACHQVWQTRKCLLKALLLKNFPVVFLCAICFNTTAWGFSQQVTISKKDVPLDKLFQEISKQTSYTFVYTESLLTQGKKVSLAFQNAPIEQVLNTCFKDLPITYSILNKLVIIKQKEISQPKENVDPLPPPITISGKITTDKGVPLQGVSVLISGTKKGATTNGEGRFELSVSNTDNIVLEVSIVGFLTKTITVGKQTELNIILEENIAGLADVVVVGYGTEKKTSITGSISSLKSKDLATITTPNLAAGLAGKLPGLRVKQNSSEPGSYNSQYDIRGYGSALIVVDGMVMQDRDFARLNPNSIEDITMLKDASAAIYGVKAANGVLLVTTKKGKVGKPVVTYSGDFQIQKFTTTPKPMNVYEFAVFSTENELNSGIAPDKTTYSAKDLENFKNGTLPGTDWYGLVTRDFSTQHSHNLNISGGSEKIKYFTSLGYLDGEGIWKSGDLNYKKYDFQSNVTSQITDNLKIDLNLYGMQDQKNEPGASAFVPGSIGGTYFSLFMQSPAVPVYANNNPKYLSDTYDGQHPLAITNSDLSGYTKTDSKTFQGIVTMTYDVHFVKGLSANVKYGYYNLTEFQKTWKSQFAMYKYDKATDAYLNTAIKNNPANMAGNFNALTRSTMLGQLNYSGSFLKNNNISATLVYEQRNERSDNMSAKSEFDANVDQFFAGTRNQQVSSSNIYELVNKSVISRITYNYSSKYLLEFGFNYGGSSLFPEGKRWGFFPYASAGWRILEEPLLKDKLPFITNLKLRGSWGEIGDDRAAAFQFLTGYTYPNGNYIFNGQVIPGLGFRSMPNPDITWTMATTKNIGLDFEINKGLVSLSFDVFQRNRSGLLATRLLSLPGTVGANLPQENLNTDMRRGFELVLGHSKRSGDFRYDISANVTYARGRATHLERATDNNSYLNWRNNTTNRWDNITWGYKVLGQFQSMEEILNSPLQGDISRGNRFIKPGDLKFEDINHDGVIDNNDFMPIGRGTMPDVNYGLNGSASYKQFDMNFLLQGSSGFNYIAGTWYDRGLLWLGRDGLNKFFDRWHHENLYDLNSPWVAGRFPSAYGNGTGSEFNRDDSEFWIENAKYLRLKSLELGYTVKVLFGLKNIRFHVSGYNFLTWTGLKDVDPERGDQLIYPIAKTFNFGLNIQL